MKRSLIIFALFCFYSITGISQAFDISGVVLDENKLAIPAVDIHLKNDETKGTSTDFEGAFTLTGVQAGETYVFSYIGYKPEEITLTSEDQQVEIVLTPDLQALGEVMVIGYGAQSRKKITGAVSKVDAEAIQKMSPVNVGQALQGTAPGVNITPQSGTPGAEVNIRIRGVSTNGNNSPLIILDGFQYEGGLSSINPDDIESFTILKDAQAAIYGSIGANGVILITTKGGKKNKDAQFDYSTYYGLQESTRELPLLNATEYALFLNESYANAGQQSPLKSMDNLGKGTNWQKEVFKSAVIYNHNLAITGGSENITYAISGAHLDQDGIVGKGKSGFTRSTGKLSLGIDLKENLKLSTNILYNHTERNNLNSFALGSVLFNAANMAPTINPEVDNLDGQIDLGNEVINPLTQIENTYNKTIANRLSGNLKVEFEYAKNLSLEGRFGFNTTNTRSRVFTPEFNYGPSKVFNVPDNSVNLSKVMDTNYTFDIFNTYKNKFNGIHAIDFMVGMTVYKEFGEGLSGYRTGVPANSFQFADIGTATGSGDDHTSDSYAYDIRRLSYFTRLQYDFMDKYLFSAILRSDSSTRFGPENRTGFFPSFTAGWILSEEDFFPEMQPTDYFKIRASYGIMGNDRIGDFLYLSLLNGQARYVSAVDGSLIIGQAPGALANPAVKWEEAKRFNIGLDTRFFNDKLGFTFDYFHNNRENLLIPNIPVSGILGVAAPGASGPTINAGNVQNSGFEFSVDYNQKVNEDFNFNIAVNLATLKNKVTKVEGADFIEGGDFGIGQPAPARMEEGKPIGYFYGYVTDGVFQSQEEADDHPSQIALGANAKAGDIRYKDLNGDGVIDENDRTDIGNPIPKLTGGFNLSINYKMFDLSMYTYANVGNDIVRNYERNQPNVNRLRYHLDRWTGLGTSNDVPRATTEATANNVFSDFYVEDGSFLRIQTINLGYHFNKEVIQTVGLKNLRLYAKVDNVFTFTKYRGYDPAASTGDPLGGGVDLGFYPSPRTYLLGLNVNF